MSQKYEKQVSIRELIIYVLSHWKAILVILFIAAIGALAVTYQSVKGTTNISISDEPQYVLIDSSYEYNAVVLTLPRWELEEPISTSTFLRAFTSKMAIENTIEELELSESYIDISNKLIYSALGSSISLGIISPVREVDGHTWEEVLSVLLENGIEQAEIYFPEYEMIVMEEPFIVNKLVPAEETSLGAGNATSTENISNKVFFSLIMRNLILYILAGSIFACVMFCCIYLLDGRLWSVEDVESNLNLPVLGVFCSKGKEKENGEELKRIAHELLLSGNSSVALLGMVSCESVIQLCDKLAKSIEERGKKVQVLHGNVSAKELQKAKEQSDILVVMPEPVNRSADAVVLAGCCQTAILGIWRGKTSGRDAVRLKAQLDRNQVTCTGTILIK